MHRILSPALEASMNRTSICRWVMALLLALAGLTAHAEGTLFKVPTRPDVKITLFWEPVGGAVGFTRLKNSPLHTMRIHGLGFPCECFSGASCGRP